MDTGDPETEPPVSKANWKLIGVVALAIVSASAGFFAGRIIDPPEPSPLPLKRISLKVAIYLPKPP